MPLYRTQLTKLTAVRVSDDGKKAEIITLFPLGVEAELVVSCFVNTATRIIATRLTIPTSDAIELADIIQEHVTANDADTPPEDIFRQMMVSVEDTPVVTTLVFMRRLTEEEAAREPDELKPYGLDTEEGWQRAAITIGAHSAVKLAGLIRETTPGILQTLAETVP